MALWKGKPETFLLHSARSSAPPCLTHMWRRSRCGLVSPALLLVVAVDMRDSPDILQVKAHPRKFSLLPTSYVLSCNIAPMPLSIQEFYVQRYRKDENPEIRSLPKKTAWSHLADTGGYAGPPQSAPGTRHGRQRQRGPQAWQVLLWPGLAVRATLGTA